MSASWITRKARPAHYRPFLASYRNSAGQLVSHGNNRFSSIRHGPNKVGASVSTTQAGVLLSPDTMANASTLEAMEVAAKTLQVGLQPFYARGASEFESVFATMANNQIGLVVVHDHPLFINDAKTISALAAKYRLPSSGFLELAAGGGLLAYGVNFPDMFRRAAVFVDKIFKGSNPSNLPVERSTKFELVINLRTAKALGLEVPPSLLARADEVIE